MVFLSEEVKSPCPRGVLKILVFVLGGKKLQIFVKKRCPREVKLGGANQQKKLPPPLFLLEYSIPLFSKTLKQSVLEGSSQKRLVNITLILIIIRQDIMETQIRPSI